MAEIPQIATRIVAEEAIRNKMDYLEELIGGIVRIAKTLPEGSNQ